MRIKEKNICFLVSSCEAFCEKTIPKNFDSLVASGVEPEDIFYIIGGNTKNIEFNGLNIIYRKDNSFEFTAFLDVVEHPDRYAKYTHIFYMHDTAFVGPLFLTKLNNILIGLENFSNIMLRSKPSMSIGIYEKQLILQQKEHILSLKNDSNDEINLQKYKKIGVAKEDCLFPDSSINFCFITNTEEKILNFNNVYQTNTLRRLKYYECLDFYKMQGNWSGFVDKMNLNL